MSMDLFQAMKERKSVRAFKNDPVPRETIEAVLQWAIRAPSAINMQPWEFTVVLGEEKARLSRRLIKAYGERRISCSPGNVKPLAPAFTARGVESFEAMKACLGETDPDIKTFVNEGSCNFYGAPAAIFICLDDSFPKERMVDIGITLGYLLLAAHAHGLGTCPIGLITAYEDEVRDCLNIPDNKQVLISVALGYPDRESPINRFTSTRDSLDRLVRWFD